MCKMYRDVSQATQNYYDNLLIKHGTRDVTETKILGTQQTLNDKMDNTQEVADDDHVNEVTGVSCHDDTNACVLHLADGTVVEDDCMKESTANVVNDDGGNVIANLFHDLDPIPAEETSVLELGGNTVVIDATEGNEVDVTNDDLSDGDGVVAVDDNSDKRSEGQAVVTAMGCNEDLNTPIITIHRSPSPNELL